MKRIWDYRWTIALALLGVAVLANFLFTSRSIFFYKMMQIEHIETLPDTPELAQTRRDAEIGSGFLEHMRVSPARLDIRSQPLRLGWIYEEAGFLGMPFYASNVASRPAVYLDNGDGYQAAGIRPEAIDAIEQAVGWPAIREHQWRWYRHAWGWLFPPLLIFLLWMWRRERHARDEREWSAYDQQS